MGTETGQHFKIVIADKINKAFKIRTSATTGEDKFYVTCRTLADDGATNDLTGDVITFTNALEGSYINLTNVAGGDAEIWLCETFGADTVASASYPGESVNGIGFDPSKSAE